MFRLPAHAHAHAPAPTHTRSLSEIFPLLPVAVPTGLSLSNGDDRRTPIHHLRTLPFPVPPPDGLAVASFISLPEIGEKMFAIKYELSYISR